MAWVGSPLRGDLARSARSADPTVDRGCQSLGQSRRSYPEKVMTFSLSSRWRRGRDWLRCAAGLRPNPSGLPVRPAAFTEPWVLIPPARLALSQALAQALERSEMSSWRRGRDSNPRYLAVHCISNAARSTTLPPLLCYQLEGASKGGLVMGQSRSQGMFPSDLGSKRWVLPRLGFAACQHVSRTPTKHSFGHFATAFAQESFRPTVRLKTGLPGCESLASAQK